MKTVIFPGSFDPLTLGHVDIVKRATGLFDKVIIAIGSNTSKAYLLPLESRVYMVEKAFSGIENVEVASYNKLTVDFCVEMGAKYILRGLRSVSDYDYERGIALMNKKLNPAIETVFLLSDPQYSGLTSTIVREIHRFGGDVSQFVPPSVAEVLNQK